MASYEQTADGLEAALSEIENSMAGTEEITRAFRDEIEVMNVVMATATQQTQGFSKSVGSSLKTAFDDLIVDGKALSDVMGKLGQNIASRTFNKAITPVTNALGGAVETGVQSLVSGLFPFAKGGVFAGGGVVNGATSFPMRGGGVGVMGEAGPEAIMPLARGADGRLGVRTAGGGGGPMNITVNIATPDVEGFRRSRSQIAAQLTRAVAAGQRNM